MERTLFALQRLTAAVLAPFLLVHLATIIYAVQGGMTTQDILARTQGNWVWISFYSLFVICVAIHVPIGMRTILIEWGRLSRWLATWICLGLAIVLLLLGLRAVVSIGGHWG